MVDSEEVRQRHEVSGTEVRTCDLCGRPIADVVPVPLEGRTAMAEPVETLCLCPTCLAALEQDEVPLDEEDGVGLRVPDV